MWRSVIGTIAVVGMLAAPAGAQGARLRTPAKLSTTTATAPSGKPVVRLAWRDVARGETRWVLRRAGLRVRLRANRTRYTDRRVVAGRRYRYRVRPCRRHRCARWRFARTVSVPVAGVPGPQDQPPVPGGDAPPAGGGDGGGGPGSGDAFAGSPTLGGCPMFPKDNPWNTDVSGLPVDQAKSDAYIGTLAGMTLWPDFGSGQYGDYGIPFGIVPSDQPLVPIRFHVSEAIAAESDPGPYPIPPDARVEAAATPGADHHVLILRQGDCRLFELFDADKEPDDGWSVYSAATFDLRSNALRPDGYTSADAAGLPMLPGLARVDEVSAGEIKHALRVTVPQTQRAYIHPATHHASSSTNPAHPPMGLRLRLRDEFDVSTLTGQARVIARALQVYGALVADNSSGSRVFVSGTPDPGWDDDDLDQLKSIPATMLEAVETGPLITGGD